MLGLLALRHQMSMRGTLLVPLEHYVCTTGGAASIRRSRTASSRRDGPWLRPRSSKRALEGCSNKLWVERTVHGSYLQRAASSLAYAHTRSYVGAVRQRCLDLATEATMIFGGEDEDTCGNRDTWGAAIAASAAIIKQ